MQKLKTTIICFLPTIGFPTAGVLAQQARPAPPQPVQLAPSSQPVPDELKGIGIDEHLDLKLPLDLKFTDEAGQAVPLGQYFDGKRPVILTLVYFGCPMLCGLVSNAQMDAMKHIDGWTPGEQYRAVTVSFDPRETHELAAMKKLNYVKAWGSPAVAKAGTSSPASRRKSTG